MAVDSQGERLSDVIFSNRMSKKEFASELGYNPSYITQICLNTKPLTRELAVKAEKRFGVNAEWLLDGKEPEKSAVSEKRSLLRDAVIEKVRRIDSDYELRAVIAFINSYEELPLLHALEGGQKEPLTLAGAPKLYRVPVKGEVAGGLPIIAREEKEEFIETPVFSDSALYLRGHSMEPDYPNGSLLLIKENAYVSNGDVVVALIMREAEVAEATCKVFRKRGGKITLSPLNPSFTEQIYRKTDGYEIKIYGKVIGIAEV